MGLALSTSWNAFRYENGRKLLFEIKKLGFEEAELSFNLTASIIKDIEKAVNEGLIKIVSLHNYCPIPADLDRDEALPDCYSMSSTYEEERALAVRFTKKTIDTASVLGGKAVVLHCGRVEMEDETRSLIHLRKRGPEEDNNFKALRDTVIKKRAQLSHVFLENALKSLEEINSYAQKKNILLGVENRFYYREIPSQDEMGIILNKFAGSNIFYWHDTGHAQLTENLGFCFHKDYLDRYGKSLIGIHQIGRAHV